MFCSSLTFSCTCPFVYFVFNDTFHTDFASILQKRVYSKHSYVSACPSSSRLFILSFISFSRFIVISLPSYRSVFIINSYVSARSSSFRVFIPLFIRFLRYVSYEFRFDHIFHWYFCFLSLNKICTYRRTKFIGY